MNWKVKVTIVRKRANVFKQTPVTSYENSSSSIGYHASAPLDRISIAITTASLPSERQKCDHGAAVLENYSVLAYI